LVCIACVAGDGILVGTWKNELNSTMNITGTRHREGIRFDFWGSYEDGSGTATGIFPFQGTGLSADYSIVLGWTIGWADNEASYNTVTGWTGDIDLRNIGQMTTTWVMKDADLAWFNTRIGQNVFTKQ